MYCMVSSKTDNVVSVGALSRGFQRGSGGLVRAEGERGTGKGNRPEVHPYLKP